MKNKFLICVFLVIAVVFCSIGAYAASTSDELPGDNIRQRGERMEPPEMPPMNGEIPDGVQAPQGDEIVHGEMPDGERIPPEGGMPQGERPDMSQMSGEVPQGNMPQRGGWGGGRGGMGMQQNFAADTAEGSAPNFFEENFTLISAGVLLVFGFVFVIFYKRKEY